MNAEQGFVLIVEDEDSIRIPLKDYLSRIGFPVLVASDGVGAIKHLLDYPIRLIISDYRMDILGGDYWVRFLERFCPHIQVLLTSGFLKPDFPLPYTILSKPYSFKELEDHVKRLVPAP